MTDGKIEIEELELWSCLKKMKKIRYYLEYIFLFCLGYVVRRLPRRLVLLMGARAGDFIFYCVPVRKKLTIKHLNNSFPEKSEREIAAIARGVYQNLALISLEHLCLPGLSKEELLKIISFENEELMQRAFSRKKGIIFVGGHFGNWEFMGGAVSLKGYPLTYVVAEIENPFVDHMVNDYRRKTGTEILSKGVSVRRILKTLRNNGSMAMLMDQDAGRNGIFVDFFGMPCSTPKGPALFALKTGAPIIFAASIRQKDGSIKVILEEIDIDHSKGTSEENVLDVMQRSTARLEYYIRKYPDHWFWMHRRWKTSPQDIGGQ